MARYQQTQLVKPISQYAPAPLKYIDEAGKAMQDQTDKGVLAVDALQEALNIKGGYQTQQRAKDFVAEYKPQLEQLAGELNSTGQINGGIGKVSSLINGLKSNPEYQDIMADQKFTESGAPDKVITQQNFDQHVQNIIDPNTGMFKQTKKGERYDDRWYNTTAPGNRNAERKKEYDQIKPVIDKIYNTPVTQSWTDEVGKVHTQSLQEGVESESLRKEQVRAALKDYYSKGDQSIFNTQAAIYSKAKAKQQGKDWTDEDELNATVDAFLGEYSNEKEIQKLGADKVTSPQKTGKSDSAGGNETNEGVPIKYNILVNSIDQSKEKAAAATSGDIVALHGGNDNKDGTFSTNTSGKPVYIQIGDAGSSGKDVENQIKLNKYIDLKSQRENTIQGIKNSVEADSHLLIGPIPVSNVFTDEDKTYKTNDGKYYAVIIGTNNYGLIDVNEKNGTHITKRMTRDEFINYETKNKITNSEKSGVLHDLNRKAEDEEVDLNDKDLALKADKMVKDPNLRQFSILMNNLSGQRKFVVGSGKNTFLDSNGDLITKQTMEVSAAELDQLMPSTYGTGGWSKVMKEHPELIKKGKVDADGNPTYNIDTFMKVDNDAAIASGQMQKNAYGTQDGNIPEWIGKALDETNQSSVNMTTALKAKYREEKFINKFESSSTSKEKITEIKDNWNKDISSMINGSDGQELFSKEQRDILTSEHARIIELPEGSPTQRQKKAKEMSDLKLFITEPDVYNMFNPSKKSNSSDGEDQATKNNNPGNLREAGENKGFRKFETIQEGYKAMTNDLKVKQSGGSTNLIPEGPNKGKKLTSSSSLLDMLRVYAPSADKNDPFIYANNVAKILGIHPDSPIGELDTDKLAEAMMQTESQAAYKKYKESQS